VPLCSQRTIKSDLATPTVPALERATLILESLAKSKSGMTISQLARSLELPKSSAHRILRTLERHHFLHLEKDSGRFRLGWQLFCLAQRAFDNVSLRDQAAPFLHQLKEKSGLTVHLAVLVQEDVIIVEKVQPPNGLFVATWVGKRVDLHCTALGKAVLAYRREDEIEYLIKRNGMLRHNENTLGSLRRLKENLALIRELGYSLDDEEEEIGIRCIGASIFNAHADSVAAISIVGSTARIGFNELPYLSEQVKRTARTISQQLGYLPQS
jgi:DNA-binding IclR family transcriptional regulator